MITVFVIAFVVAYILEPYVDRLNNLICHRPTAVLLVLLVFLSALVLLLFSVVPQVYAQSQRFAEQLPTYIVYIYNKFQVLMPKLGNYVNNSSFDQFQRNISKVFFDAAKLIASQAVKSVFALINSVLAITLLPVMVFYYLNDWSKICTSVDQVIPKRYYSVVKSLLDAINANVSGYIRGQIKVCILLGIFYSIFLTVVGLQYSLFIGMATGILCFMPYIGAIFGFVASHLVAFSQYESALDILLVTAVFATGQIIESLFLTPKLIGKSVNLHPAWVIFAVVLGGNLFGFLGVLISIPTASVVAVFVRFGVLQYKKSKYYEPKTTATN